MKSLISFFLQIYNNCLLYYLQVDSCGILQGFISLDLLNKVKTKMLKMWIKKLSTVINTRDYIVLINYSQTFQLKHRLY
jgi:hypothetical protein